MDYDLSKPQKLLQESVRTFCQRECSTERVRQLMETESAFDNELWQAIAEQGWIGLHLSEEYDGLGLGLVDLAVVAEELGRACLPGPFLATTWAATLLAESGNQELAASYLPRIVDGSSKATVAFLEENASWELDSPNLAIQITGDHCTINGSKQFVVDAAVADLIICAAKSGDQSCMVLVQPDDANLRITPTPGIDATRKLYRVDFDNVSVSSNRVLAVGHSANAALKRSAQVGTVCVCAELVGGMQWMHETTVEYAKTRRQFEQVIGSFQAVQHQCADMLLMTESSRSAAYYAAWALSENDSDADRAVSIAKAYCSDSARQVGNCAIQVHGGIGFTWEHDLHLYYKRAKASELIFGDATFHRELLARLVIDTQTERA